MKFNKQTSLCLFLAGTILFSGAALADVLIGSGYSGAKQSLKHTAEVLTEDTDSFTLKVGYESKCDGDILESSEEIYKLDIKNQKKIEQSKVTRTGTADYENYYYRDNEKLIYKRTDDDIYHQRNITGMPENIGFENPFEEEYAKDIEKVVDAFVSGMKDFVQIKDEADGAKLYYGDIDASQMPAFISALSSVIIKYGYLDSYNMSRNNLPKMKEVYISGASGRALENADGLLEDMVFGITATALDEKNKEHIFEFSMTASVSDVNCTDVTAPDVGENVEITEEKNVETYGEITEKDKGVYCSDIVRNDKDAYTKIGTRVITINEVESNNDTITGHITVSGTDEYCGINSDFTAKLSKNTNSYSFEYTDADGNGKIGILHKDGYLNTYATCLRVCLDVKIEYDEAGNMIGHMSRENYSEFAAIRQFDQ